MNERKDRETKRAERRNLSSDALLHLLHDRLDDLDEWREAIDGRVTRIESRLKDGDQLFAVAEKREKQHEADWTSAMRFMHNLNLRLAHFDPGAKQDADAIEGAIGERFANGNGADRELTTNRNNDRPTDAE